MRHLTIGGRLRRVSIFFIGVALTTAASAQHLVDHEDRLAKDRPEFWAMKLVGSEVMLTSMGVPGRVEPGKIDLGLELGWLPSLSREQRLIGFNGTKEEHVNRTPLVARPRVNIGLPQDLTLTLGYIPPVRLGGIQPNILAVSVGRPLVTLDKWRLGLRLLGQVGRLRGDVTCDRETVGAGLDATRNPFGCEAPSDDRLTIRSGGVELGNAFVISPRAEPYIAVSWNYFDTEFQTDARYSGVIDRSRSVGSGPSVALTTGISYRIRPQVRFGGELFYTPLDVRRFQQPRTNDGLMNVRAALWYELR
jgi:hypothetical protein